jgi:hypothetical protein
MNNKRKRDVWILSLVAIAILIGFSDALAMEAKNVWMNKSGWFAKYTNCLKYEGSISCKRYVPKIKCVAKTNDDTFAFQVVRSTAPIKMDERWARGGFCAETFGCYPPYEIQFISACDIRIGR